MVYYNNTNELYHHGIKGQKWGVRRYENPDGSLTPAGKKRYADDNADSNKNDPKAARKKKIKKILKVAGITAGSVLTGMLVLTKIMDNVRGNETPIRKSINLKEHERIEYDRLNKWNDILLDAYSRLIVKNGDKYDWTDVEDLAKRKELQYKWKTNKDKITEKFTRIQNKIIDGKNKFLPTGAQIPHFGTHEYAEYLKRKYNLEYSSEY